MQPKFHFTGIHIFDLRILGYDIENISGINRGVHDGEAT